MAPSIKGAAGVRKLVNGLFWLAFVVLVVTLFICGMSGECQPLQIPEDF